MNPRVERRQFPRSKISLATWIRFPDTGKLRRALTKNIGANGICAITEQLIEPNTRLEVEMKLPQSEQTVKFKTQVIWSKPVGGPGKSYENPTAETGMKFVEIDSDVRSKIANCVAINAVSSEP